MSREELTDKMVTDVMEDFDFETVHQVMVNLDWEWDIGNGEMTIPSTYRIMKTADRLLRKAASHYGEKKRLLHRHRWFSGYARRRDSHHPIHSERVFSI